ncbi:MAG: HAMP domain-containing histidine kinase [Bryobacterales bacterium]|nr:HAMP domain-containing histidine kinase [Bryobacterales bacterium]
MKPRLRLSTKILLLVLLNLTLLAIVFAIFVRVQLRLELESFLLAPARERITSVSRLLALELEDTEESKRNELLARYSAAHGVTFYLFRGEGEQVAGPNVDLPEQVKDRLRRGRFRGRLPVLPLPPAGEQPALPPSSPPFLVVTENPDMYWVGVRIPLRGPASPDPVRGTILLSSPRLLTNPFFFDPKPWLGATAAVLLISFLCWLPLIRGMKRSIEQMKQAAERIAEGQFDVRIPANRGDEIGQLGTAIRRMAARLEGFVQGQKRFLGDIAHELCSPLARMQLALAILERKAQGSLAGSIADLREEVADMSSLVNELLSFSKAGMKTAEVRLSNVNVARAIQRVVEREANGTPVHVEADPLLEVTAEPDYLHRSLSNLIRNAVRYAGQEGKIEVSANSAGQDVVIKVADNGPGIPDEALEQIFAPFYRVEDSRDRRTGGTGLGLAIVKSCVEACQGTVSCRNRKPTGLEVEIRLPAAAHGGT